MDNRFRLVILAALVGCSISSHAAYTTLTPPPGWSAGAGALVSGAGGSFAATTANQWIANAAKSSAMLNVGGKQLAVPVSMKLAPTAGRVAAAALFLSPQLRAAVGIASWLGVAGVVWDAAHNRWTVPNSDNAASDGSEYSISNHPHSTPWVASPIDACVSYAAILTAASQLHSDPKFRSTFMYTHILPGPTQYCYMTMTNQNSGTTESSIRIDKKVSSCPAGWYVTAAGCVQNAPMRQLTQEEMVDLLNPDNTPGWPNPNTPNEFPIPLPIQLPIINPDTGVNPFPKPFFVPTGQPVKNPQYDPSKPAVGDNLPWNQPGVTVTPRSKVGSPWQVDLAPTDRPQEGPDPKTDEEHNPDSEPNDKPKPEETQSLCEKHPEILACQKVVPGDLSPEVVKDKKVSLVITPDSGFGPSTGACPAPKTAVVMGKSISMPYDLICTFADSIRPIVLAFAWLTAAMTFFGFSRRD